MTYSEVQLFDEPALRRGPPPEPKASTFSELVVRKPGWVLVAQRSGPKGFHVIRGSGLWSSVITLCGVAGRIVPESQLHITECLACRDATTTP